MNDASNLSDEALTNKMKESKTIEEWNSNRDYCKKHRDQKWISKEVDQSGLIFKVLPNSKPLGSNGSNQLQSNG